MAFCASCGTSLQEETQFCPKCGTPVTVFGSTKYKMNLVNAFKRVVFENYANFNDRASRAEYWWYVLASILVGFITGFIDGFFGLNILNLLASLVLLVPGLAAATRRLHDTNRSGWWQLLTLTIIGIIPLIIWLVAPSDQIENRFGSVPSV